MINPFTVQSRIQNIQQQVLQPLYMIYPEQQDARHDWLLVKTGRAIAENKKYIEEFCCSRFVAVIFKIVKLLGGADQLTEQDFHRFTSYVNDGGIEAMIKMLLAADKQKTFISELQNLPVDVRKNAPLMLKKSAELHKDFITGFFKENYGSISQVPPKLMDNFQKSNSFIERLTLLAIEDLKKIS